MLLVYATTTAFALAATTLASDPCAAIAGQKWVAPSAALRCLRNFPVDDAVKASTIQTLNRTLAFHTSVNYQLQAPAPFADVHEDIHRDLARIQDTEYPTAFDLHLDLYYSFRRLADGHCTTLNLCFDSLYISYLPTPLVLLTDSEGVQNVHIASEAFTVASAEFPDQIELWQDALNGQLESVRGLFRTFWRLAIFRWASTASWFTITTPCRAPPAQQKGGEKFG
ncbi:Peptidase S41 family protein ustP [Mycena kentingensis (nom. inval.)]|nr:Peptidase S41 family protein ustP [Mycena kentingensis (nom. inval.)]